MIDNSDHDDNSQQSQYHGITDTNMHDSSWLQWDTSTLVIVIVLIYRVVWTIRIFKLQKAMQYFVLITSVHN